MRRLSGPILAAIAIFVAIAPPASALEGRARMRNPAPVPTEAVVELRLDTHAVLVGRVRPGASVDVYPAPEAPEPTRELQPTTILGTATVVMVVDDPGTGWLEVLLPVRPNGTTGWVRATDLLLYVVEDRIVVDLSDRRLTLYQDGAPAFTAEVAVGSEATPTPTGTFYVTDRVRLTDPNSIWGPYALGLSGRSEVVLEYNGGDGIIGIHGTSRPGSVGQAASLGCLRLENGEMTTLFGMVMVGTPVQINA